MVHSIPEVEAKEAGRVKVAEAGEELAVGDMTVPTPGNNSSADEGGGEVNAEDDLPKEVVIVQHLGDGIHDICQCLGMLQ